MGICCAQGNRGTGVDHGEKNFRSNSNVLGAVEERTGNKHGRDDTSEVELPEEAEFKREASKMRSHNENTNVRCSPNSSSSVNRAEAREVQVRSATARRRKADAEGAADAGERGCLLRLLVRLVAYL